MVLPALLTAWLGALEVLRFHKRRKREARWPRTPFDISEIALQIRLYRQDCQAEARSRSRQTFYRAEWLAMARKVIAAMPYFRDVAARSQGEHQAGRHGL